MVLHLTYSIDVLHLIVAVIKQFLVANVNGLNAVSTDFNACSCMQHRPNFMLCMFFISWYICINM